MSLHFIVLFIFLIHSDSASQLADHQNIIETLTKSFLWPNNNTQFTKLKPKPVIRDNSNQEISNIIQVSILLPSNPKLGIINFAHEIAFFHLSFLEK